MYKIKINSILLLVILVTNSCSEPSQRAESRANGNTFCNPLNLDYRFMVSGNSYREAADPIVVLYHNDYYLFASHSGGYWWSPDFQSWNFVTPTGLDIEKYAPSVWFIGNIMYYTSSESGDIYQTSDPKAGIWEYVSHPHDFNDPWVYVDTDGKVYAYHGCSENGAIECVQLDPKNKFKVIGTEAKCILSNPANNGFEVNGENNEGGLPWTEGSAMIKYHDKYYLSFATPGTEKRSYCDAYYTADSPMGPFSLGINSPATRKSLGFVTGTGHGGFFLDKAGKLWTVTTVTISIKHIFERRLAIFPAEIEVNGLMHTNTVMGDYPQYYPGVAMHPVSDNSPKWNLISKGKTVTVSSSYNEFEAANAVDENIRTYWSASTGNTGEWLMIDLGKNCTVNGIQSNFYESQTIYASGRDTSFSIKYIIEYSTDNSNWTMLIDKSASTKDTPHDYVQLQKPVNARYLRITNMGQVPGNGLFSLSDFRIFGNGGGSAPLAIKKVKATRLPDQRCTDLSWEPVIGADGYIIRYGIAPEQLWNHYQVWNDTAFSIRSLVAGQTYYFRVDAYNENGITPGAQVVSASCKK